MLKLDYDALATSSKALKAEGDKFEDCIDVMGKEINGLPDIWEAETCTEYVNQYQKAEKTLKEVRKMIQEMAEQMDTISKNFADADTSMKNQM